MHHHVRYFHQCRTLKKYDDGLILLQFSVDVYWDQVARGKFFLHEHLATDSSWGLPMIWELAVHPGVTIATGDICRWGMHLVEHKETQGIDQSILVKKPTKWMTNCPSLATLLSARCAGGHEHSRLDGRFA